MKLLRYPDWMANMAFQTMVHDEFTEYVDTQRWTKAVNGTGAAAAIAAGGTGVVLQLSSGTVANGSAIVAFTNAAFKYLAGCVWSCEFYAQYAEANTNNAIIGLGMSSVVTSSLLADSTGVPASSFSGALLYKPQGTLNWSAISSVGTTQNITAGNQSTTGTTGGPFNNGYRLFRIEARDVDGTNFEVTYFIDNAPLLDTTSFHRPIKHTIALTSAAAMKPVIFLKGVNGTTAETLNVEAFWAMQRRG